MTTAYQVVDLSDNLTSPIINDALLLMIAT